MESKRTRGRPDRDTLALLTACHARLAAAGYIFSVDRPTDVLWLLSLSPQAPGAPPYLLLGRELGLGSKHSKRLKEQPSLGPTTMDPDLSVWMAGQALLRPESLCLEPFAGTGRIAAACALRGARLVCVCFFFHFYFCNSRLLASLFDCPISYRKCFFPSLAHRLGAGCDVSKQSGRQIAENFSCFQLPVPGTLLRPLCSHRLTLLQLCRLLASRCVLCVC